MPVTQINGQTQIQANTITADRLAGSGAAAGAYTNASITIDAAGLVTAASNGTALLAQVFGETPSGTLNGTNVAFTTVNAPITGTLRVYQNGIRVLATNYTLSGSTITFTTAPLATDTLEVDYNH